MPTAQRRTPATTKKVVTRKAPPAKPPVAKKLTATDVIQAGAVTAATLSQNAITGPKVNPEVSQLAVTLTDANVRRYENPVDYGTKDGMFYVIQQPIEVSEKSGKSMVNMTSQTRNMFPVSRVHSVEVRTVTTKVNGK